MNRLNKENKGLSKSLIQFYKSPLGYSIILSLIFLVVGAAFFHPFFEESDDLSIALISEGALGYRDFHLIYVNVILGKIITALSMILPMIRWHVVIQYLFIFISLFSFSMFLSHFKNGRMAALAMQLCCFYELYVSFQYTKVVTFIATASMIIILYYLKDRCLGSHKVTGNNEVKSFGIYDRLMVDFKGSEIKLLLIASYVTIIYAILLRDSAFLIAVVFSGVLLAVHVYEVFIKAGIKSLINYVIYIAPVFVFLLAAMLINSAAYTAPEWQYFNEFNKARTSVVDYRYDSLDYSRYGDALAAEGISENDAYMYVTWQFDDEKVVSSKLFNKMVDTAGPRAIDVDLIKAFVSNIYETFFVFNAAIIALMLLIAVLLTRLSHGPKTIFVLCLEAALSSAVLFYYHYSGRWNHRLVFSMILSLIVIFLAHLIVECNEGDGVVYTFSSTPQPAMSQLIKVLTIVTFVAVVGHRLENEFTYQDYLRSNQNFSDLAIYMNDHKDTLFVADTFTSINRFKYDVFKPAKVGALDNYLTTGGWISKSPLTNSIAANHGYADAFDALYGRADNVFLIDNHCPERKITYLTEHSGENYSLEYIDNIAGYNCYRVK